MFATDAERSSLAEELFRLHQGIFAGVERQAFEDKVINPPARWTRIQVIRSDEDRALGYCAVHLYDMWVRARHYVVFRAEAGIRLNGCTPSALWSIRRATISWLSASGRYTRAIGDQPRCPSRDSCTNWPTRLVSLGSIPMIPPSGKSGGSPATARMRPPSGTRATRPTSSSSCDSIPAIERGMDS